MLFFHLYLQGLGVIMLLMTILWIFSVLLKNASIVDPFWGFGYVLAAFFYFFEVGNYSPRTFLVLLLVTIWGMRLSLYLGIRNWGKGEDFRYQKFRQDYGPKRYWWFSFFQVFLLQGVLMWLISAPLLAIPFYSSNTELSFLDYIALIVWIIGVIFEAGGDFQLNRFKKNPSNKGKVLNTGLWKYTRHPNYFGDATIWWAYGLFAIGVGAYWPFLSSLLMTVLIIKVSGVVLLEKTLSNTKPQYKSYVEKTSAFIPWFPKK